ncbi:hypothetical protein M422DRAFT_226905 [Sphaerobolus stellatus SS14]|uniref:Oxidoreductase n=1 Tax=Sphaerobolus stellatus (strain SS14) TaxID=990650 RepID=A0A0C9VTC9_SPHS4|nr:hypothetical protein M422DRAFT_226905 [Sphaerobolus stellatus SS14]
MTEQKVAFVTGCTTGTIGFSYCEGLLKRDFIVYATSRSVASIQGLDHPNAKILALDVTSDEQVTSVVEKIINDHGHIDLLINNAGVLAPGAVLDCTTEEIKQIYDVNVFSMLRVAKAVVPHMAKRREGIIINMGSIVGEFPTPWMGIYDSSKAAVRIMTEILSLECRPFSIHVMLVAPASIQSPMVARHDNYQLPADSLYQDFSRNIRERLDAGKDSDVVMPTEAFTEEILTKALGSRNPPAYILTGGKSWMFRLMAYLPRKWVLNIVWGMFSKPGEKAKGSWFLLVSLHRGVG